MRTISELEFRKYQFGIDLNQSRRLYGKNDKVIYLGEWLQERRDRCIIVEMITDVGKHEAEFFKKLNDHENIIRTFGYVENSFDRIIYVQEYAKYNDLHSFLYANPLSQIILIQFFLQIAKAMEFIANKSIVHGDLGCRNILVFEFDAKQSDRNLVKITDFGLARSLKTPSRYKCSTIVPIRYCALEILRSHSESNYTEKSDVYSMGILMWEALSNGEFPYSYIETDDLVVKAKLDNEKLLRPHICNDQLWSLIEVCWDDDQEYRPNFHDIIDRLSTIRPSEVHDEQKSNSKYKPPNGYDFKLNVDVTRNNLIGGKFRKIYAAEWIRITKEPIVLIEMSEKPTDYELSFFKITRNCEHLINIFGFVENNFGSIMVLQERASHGHLQELLQNRLYEPLPIVLISIFLQIVDAMIYIIGNGMIHGNLCCSNVLVFQMDDIKPDQNIIKLANFAFARPNNELLSNDTCSTIPVEYCAPEILRSAGRRNYSELSEIYSMGVLMWQAYSQGKSPYDSSMLDREIRQKKLNGEILCRPWKCDRQIWSIMKHCWSNTADSRGNFNNMKAQLSNVNLERRYEYSLFVDVKMKNKLYGGHRRIFYEAEWMQKRKEDILLLVLHTKRAEREASFYIELSSHEHIVHTFGLVKTESQSVILLQERAQHADLLSLLKNEGLKPSSQVLLQIFKQIVDAMIYITEQDIIHGDLRCANVLVFQMSSTEVNKNIVKLTNFSVACTNDPSFRNDGYTSAIMRYAAPEIIESRGQSNYSEFSDVYSMGVLMWEACSKGCVPYRSETTDDDIRRKKLDGVKLPMPEKCDEQLWKIMKDCWYTEPELRFSFSDMMKRLSTVKLPDVVDISQDDIKNKPLMNQSLNNNKRLADQSISNKKPRIHEPTPDITTESELQNLRPSSSVRLKSRTTNPQDIYQQPITSEPTIRIQCKYCNREFTWDKLDDHEQFCLQHTHAPPQLLSQPRKLNAWERFCSFLLCCKRE